MAGLVRYRSIVYDSSRWEGFRFRPGDIVISTPPKCGTTWTQMICALLILQTPELDRPLSEYSPWLDMTSRSLREVLADLEAQTHRRFIKTHTPLDGLPQDPSVTYLCVARDPRDVALSIDHHFDNLDLETFAAARAAAAAADGLPSEPARPAPPRPADPRDRFWAWVDNDAPVTEVGSSLVRTVRHIEQFWNARRRDGLDVVLLHFAELKADLEGQMRALAGRLGITVPEERWPELVAAASFESMRANAASTAPNAQQSIWHDTTTFFHRGTSGQWRDLLDADDLARYERQVAALVEADLAAWLHQS